MLLRLTDEGVLTLGNVFLQFGLFSRGELAIQLPLQEWNGKDEFFVPGLSWFAILGIF